ncbi:MAG TPA: glycosyltransferase [Acidimicrobiales bacterium]|jgi:cellulose synthase (UDP-forming)
MVERLAVGARWADDAMPPPESAGRKLAIRSMAVFACTLTLTYLVWRLGWSIRGASLWVGLALIAVEAHNALGLFLFTFSLWDLDPPPVPEPVDETELRLAILIPTYNEPIEVLLPAVSAAVAVRPAHETWVLDDGDRPEVAALAAQLGARYLTREDRSHAKAGNLNHALGVIDADIVGVVDADHVVTEDFLRHTLGYFDDPGVAVVQTPQSFYNHDSFEHEDAARRPFSEQDVFYRVILPAKNRWKAGFWCGTGALVRTEALRSVGGVATESVTEDIQTSIRMQRAGWRMIVHNEVLAHGLAATDAQQYWLQRYRWSQGAMQVLRQDKILTGPGLTLPQRLAYGATLFAWFDAWRILAYFFIPMAVIVTGALPVGISTAIFGPAFLTVLFVQFVALRLLARGHYPPFWSLVFEALRLPAVVPATMKGLRGKPAAFKVTPKGQAEHRQRTDAAPLHAALLGLTVLALAWMVATLAGFTPVHYRSAGGVLGCAAFLLLNASVVIAAGMRVRSERFAGEQRASVRFESDAQAAFQGRPGQLLDLSLTGARLELPAGSGLSAAGSEVTLDLPDHGLSLRCEVVRAVAGMSSTVVSVRFAPGQSLTVGQLALAIFHDGQPASEEADERDAVAA